MTRRGGGGRSLSLIVALGLGVFLAGCGGREPLTPVDPYQAVIEATGEYRLVALGEFHQMQEWHDFMAELMGRDEFIANVDDIVVEFGNGLYQDVADRYIVDLEEVAFQELSQVWRNTIGGGVLWDAPVYEQFFRNVRTVNKGLPRDRRIRVLLGDPDVDLEAIRTADEMVEAAVVDRDEFFAGVVEREVISEGRTAILIAGADHLRRGVHANTGSEFPNVATLLARDNPDELFIVYPLPYWYEQTVWARLETELGDASRPSLAYLDGTWLGDVELSHRALESGSRFGEQVDAVIWFGPEETLTRSQADSALYRSGEYAEELQRRSEIHTEYFGEPIDYIAEGLRLATSDPALRGP